MAAEAPALRFSGQKLVGVYMHVRKDRTPCKLQDFLVMKHWYFMRDALDACADEHEVRPRGQLEISSLKLKAADAGAWHSWDSVRISSRTCVGDIHFVIENTRAFLLRGKWPGWQATAQDSQPFFAARTCSDLPQRVCERSGSGLAPGTFVLKTLKACNTREGPASLRRGCMGRGPRGATRAALLQPRPRRPVAGKARSAAGLTP